MSGGRYLAWWRILLFWFASMTMGGQTVYFLRSVRDGAPIIPNGMGFGIVGLMFVCIGIISTAPKLRIGPS
jgi:hypothetical protein